MSKREWFRSSTLLLTRIRHLAIGFWRRWIQVTQGIFAVRGFIFPTCVLALTIVMGVQLLAPSSTPAQSTPSPRYPKKESNTRSTRPVVPAQAQFERQPRSPRDSIPRIQQVQEQEPRRVSEQEGLRVDQGEEAQHPPPAGSEFATLPAMNMEQYLSPQGLSSSIGMAALLTIISLAPAILMMSTCFVRFIVVLSLLRQALGTTNLPPNQVLMGLSLFLTFLVMSPVWNECYHQGILPYTDPAAGQSRPHPIVAFENTVRPLRRFMSQQIEQAHNPETVWMFLEYQRPRPGTPGFSTWKEPQTYDEVPLTVLLPAYLLSELKAAFLIGFQIYLPFLILDLVVAATLMGMGLTMISPGQISLPFKLLLFVLIDGWTLTVGMLIESVRIAT